jgi:UDP-N-acetylmuramoyl-L-alanyl-D-glutamate--2,6-diaminopimelate ligase
MRLDALIDDAPLPATATVTGAAASGVEVDDVVISTAAVRVGALFCCVRGSRVDGHDLAADAVAAGAVAVVADHALDLPGEVAQVLVPDVRAAVGPLAAAFHRHPSRSLTVVGITGTNGKTTTTHLLQSAVQAAGRLAAVIGTLSGGDPGSPGTTPDAPALQSHLADLRDAGVEVVAMEVSSHGLAMHRVDGTRFAVAAFTNLSQDHLDLHGTMEAYFAAKARLFDPAFTDRAVVDLDDPRGRLLRDAALVPTEGYSLADADDLRLEVGGSTFVWREVPVRVPLAGRYNVANALCALTVAAALGIAPEVAAAGIAATPAVPGRFEPVRAGQPFGVVVDYAHTPDGLEHVIGAAREIVGTGRVVVVFGAGGDRDAGKRPRMGEVAARLADRVVVTSDNPRSEDPGAIVAAIVEGVAAGDTAKVTVDVDRRAAIAQAIGSAGAGDIVLIAGKGHETTQTVGDAVLPFDDRVEAAAALEQAGWRPRADAIEDGAT